MIELLTILFVIMIIIHSIDIIETYYLLKHHPHETYESNPLVRRLMNKIGNVPTLIAITIFLLVTLYIGMSFLVSTYVAYIKFYPEEITIIYTFLVTILVICTLIRTYVIIHNGRTIYEINSESYGRKQYHWTKAFE